MAEKGKVTKVSPKGFGFVSRVSGRDLFVPSFELRSVGAGVGDEVEFEEIDDPKNPGKKMASKLVVVAKAAPAAPPTPPALGVTWKFGEFVTGFLPVMITVMRGTTAALGMVVRLIANGKKVKTPKAELSPDALGTVTFVVELAQDAKQCVLMAQIDGQLISKLWEAPKPVPPPPAPKPEPPKVEKSPRNSDGIYVFRIVAVPNQDMAIRGNVEVEARKQPADAWSAGPFTTDTTGRLNLEIRVKQESSRGEITFEYAGLVSEPRYVAHSKRS